MATSTSVPTTLLGKIATAAGGAATIAAGIGLATAAIYSDISRSTTQSDVRGFGDANVTVSFPPDLTTVVPKGKEQFMLFSFYGYSRPYVTAAPELAPQMGHIWLPLPSELIDRVTLNYASTSTNPVAAAALESLGQFKQAQQQAHETTLGEVASSVWNGAKNIAAGAATGMISSNVDRLLGLIGADNNGTAKALQVMGVAQNPFLTMLFNAPEFKRYTFSWTFIPRNQKESDILQFLLNKLRYHALPGLVDNAVGLYLSYPDIVRVDMYPQGYMFDFKHCVIENLLIDLVPSDTPAFFNDTMAPVAVRLTMSLLEIELWLKKDLEDGSSNH